MFDGWFDAIGVPGENPQPPLGDTPPPLSSDREPVADVPAGSLGDGPSYRRPVARPAAQDELQADDPGPEAAREVRARRRPRARSSSRSLATPTIADKTWVSRQYDHQLFLNTVAGPGADAAVLRVKGTPKALALATDGKARFCQLDPRPGGRLVVLEAARNVATTGARPLALVNCLNFGNPEHPEVMWQFSEVVEGISEACEALGIPVVGGNVSFYNESRGADIHPTPVVSVIGLIDDLPDAPPGPALSGGDSIVVLGATRPELGGSEWAAVLHGETGGLPPVADLADRRAGCTSSSPRSSSTARPRACTTSAMAGSRWRWPRWRSRAGLGSRWTSPRTGARRRRRASPSRRRASCSPSRATASPRSSVARSPRVCRPRWSATRGGDRLIAKGAFDVALGDAGRRVAERAAGVAQSGGLSPAPSSQAITSAADSSGLFPAVSMRSSGCAGISYGSDTPVNSGMSPGARLGVEALDVARLAVLE